MMDNLRGSVTQMVQLWYARAAWMAGRMANINETPIISNSKRRSDRSGVLTYHQKASLQLEQVK
jgi:hypothetical protein